MIFLSALLLIQAATTSERPADVVRHATHAVNVDSVAPFVARWRSDLGRDSANVAAHLALGTISQLTYDLADANRHFRAIIDSPSAQYRAWATLGVGLTRLYRVHFDTASAWFTRAATLARGANDSSALAYAMVANALARARLGDALRGRAIVDSALGLTPARDPMIRALGLCVRSHIWWYLGNPRAAVADGSNGLATVRQQPDLSIEAFCHVMHGAGLLLSGDEHRSKVEFDTALALSVRAHDRLSGAVALFWKGHHELEYYEHAEAQRDLSASLVEAQASGNRFVETFSWLRLAIVSWHFGDLVSARQQIERGRAIGRELGDSWAGAYARLIDAGVAFDAGQLDEAERALRDDLAWATRMAQPIEEYSALFGLARVASARDDWSGARKHLADAERIATGSKLFGLVPQLEYEQALVSLRAGDLDDAERRLRAVIASPGLADLDRYATRSRVAQIALQRGDPARAKRELVDATNALDSLRSALGERELRMLAFQARKGYDDGDLGFATIIGGLAGAGYVDDALALAERRRARELRDRLMRTTEGLTPVVDVAAVGPGSEPRPLADGRTAVLEYVTGPGPQPTTLFVQTAAGTGAYRLPPAESLAVDIKAFAALVEGGANPGALAKSLGASVFSSALDSLPASVARMIIVPDGPFQRLPFDALRMQDGRYVVERFAVTLAPSISVARELRARKSRSGSTRLLAFGDPRFSNEIRSGAGSAADVFREAFSANGGLPRLPGSASEAKLVARYAHRSELRLRGDASESYLKRAALDSFDIIHLATHALVDETSVARTALAVAAGDGDDGFVGPGELSSLKLSAQLVVLSACRTAQGVAIRGEGVQGLTAPLLAAGARSVLATQWRIRDADAVQYIEDFYRALAAGSTVSDASRAAKLAAIGRGSSPATWAAFTIVGDPFATIPLRAPNEYESWLMVAAGVSAAVFAAYRVGVRRRRVADRRSDPSGSVALTPQ